MLIFDFFAGTGSATKAFEDRGHKVIKIELDPYFDADERDILGLSAEYLITKYGRPDFVWASPPCTSFSIASVSHHWTKEGLPKTSKAVLGLNLVVHTLNLIKDLGVTNWIMENPRGMLRKQPIVKHLPRTTITYCAYGDIRMKPTDIWGNVANWTPRTMCKNGQTCHQSAPRGAKTGTQGLKGSKVRSMVPYQLGEEILNSLEQKNGS